MSARPRPLRVPALWGSAGGADSGGAAEDKVEGRPPGLS